MCMYAAAGVKKPGGTAEEVEKHFGCDSSQLIMVNMNLYCLFSIRLGIHYVV